jgi:hypothetical protein
MLKIQEKIVQSPISFTEGLQDLIDCVVNLKFTKHGVRIAGMPPYNAKKGKLLEVRNCLNFINSI